MTQTTQPAEYEPPSRRKICPVCFNPVSGRICETHRVPAVAEGSFSKDSPLHKRVRPIKTAPSQAVKSDEFKKTEEYITHQKQPDVETF